MSKNKKILILLLGIVALVGLGIVPLQLSVYSYAKEVPIQLGYDKAQNYWVLSSIINEEEKFKMALHADETDEVDSENQAKAQSEVGLLFEPRRPISTTDLDPYDITFFSTATDRVKAPSYALNPAGWLTTARYTVGVYKTNQEITSQDVDVNYKKPHVITLATPNGDVTLNNQGMIAQGVEVPSGELVAVKGPYSTSRYYLFSKYDFGSMIDQWNWEFTNFGFVYPHPWGVYSWADLWHWAEDTDNLPKEVKLVHVEQINYHGDMDYITLFYANLVFAASVTTHIPAELADTIIINLYQPKPEIVNVSPSPLPAIYEGEYVDFSATIKNIGTKGTISVTITSERYVANPITETFASFEEGETLVFRWQIYALNVEDDITADIRVYAEGRGGDDEIIVEGTILDKKGYTPPDPPPPPDPVPPDEGAFPWYLLVLVVVGGVVIWYMWRRHK